MNNHSHRNGGRSLVIVEQAGRGTQTRYEAPPLKPAAVEKKPAGDWKSEFLKSPAARERVAAIRNKIGI